MRLTLITIFLCIVVIQLGAYTRLTDAGLGCPDWPGCYGQIYLENEATTLVSAQQLYPTIPLYLDKATTEMTHRYIAATLGLAILVIFIRIAVQKTAILSLKLPSVLVILVLLQALLGKWTVSFKLHPTVVSAHLLGGFLICSLLQLVYLHYRHRHKPDALVALSSVLSLFPWCIMGLIILTLQIFLGVWTSSNYAALVCNQLDFCQQSLQFTQAFGFWNFNDSSYLYGQLPYTARVSIQNTHKIGALITFAYLFILAIYLYRLSIKKAAMLLTFLLVIQIILGAINVLYQLPLFSALAHNFVALMLLLQLVHINYFVYMTRRQHE